MIMKFKNHARLNNLPLLCAIWDYTFNILIVMKDFSLLII